jgi:prolyl oligopeptidase
VLLRLESRAGHGAGKPLSKVVDELTDSWTFVFCELGVEV